VLEDALGEKCRRVINESYTPVTAASNLHRGMKSLFTNPCVLPKI
jgi:hypothetical protein